MENIYFKNILNTTNPIYLLIGYSFLSASVTIITSKYIKQQNLIPFICIRYITDIICLIFIYLFILSQKDKSFVFSIESSNIWYISLFISLISLVMFILHTICLDKVGPTKTESITHVFGTIFTFMLSYFILKNTNINFKGVLGLILCIIGMYLVIYNSNYV